MPRRIILNYKPVCETEVDIETITQDQPSRTEQTSLSIDQNQELLETAFKNQTFNTECVKLDSPTLIYGFHNSGITESFNTIISCVYMMKMPGKIFDKS